jgi:sulfur-carrier protein
MAQVVLPGSLVMLFPGAPRRLTIPGSTVAEVVRALDVQVPGLADRVLTTGPAIREHINVFVDGEPAALETPVAGDATIHIIPAVSGG